MRVGLLAWTALLAGTALANEVTLNRDDADRQRCSGMYSRRSWGGDVEPFILTKFKKYVPADGTDEDPLVSLVIFEWKDEPLIGRYQDDQEVVEFELPKETICDPENVEAHLCEEKDIGAFILEKNATIKSQNPLISQAIHLNDPPAINYPIKKTGFYCVSTFGYSGQDYEAIVEFRNSYGELPAAQIAKLPFYGGLTIVYAVVGAFWAFLYAQHRHDILPVQNYITAILVFLVVEQLMTWGFYDYQNRHGSNAGSRILMIIVAILNAGRNSFSFFLLLIVCMGYGVVKHSLGKTMIYVRFLGIGHFVFGVIYAIASFSVTPDNAGPLVLLVILPLAGTLIAFYVWTLNSLSMTMKDLVDRKQHTKAMMYKKLWWCILGSIMVIFGFFFINSFAFAGRNEANFVPEHWQTRWFILDGWLNLVYLFDIAFVAYLWRPTANNRRFAMSDELAQDDDGGFEIHSLAGSFDEDEEDGRPPAYDRPLPSHNNHNDIAAADRELTPVPPKPIASPQPATAARRESLDGETIFAVGEDGDVDDKWSDDDDDSIRESAERSRLTGQHS